MEILKDETGSQGNLLLSKYENQKAFRNFILSLRSECTRKLYSFYLLKFLSHNQNYVDLSLDEILKIDHKIIETDIIETMIKMKEDEKLSSSSTPLLLAAVFHFFSINDVMLNRKKISKFAREHEKTEGGTWYPQACIFLKLKPPYPFLFGEKLDRKNDTVYQGQNRKFR
jgi:hypothetical protein